MTERTRCTYNPLDVTPVTVSLHSKLVTLNYRRIRHWIITVYLSLQPL